MHGPGWMSLVDFKSDGRVDLSTNAIQSNYMLPTAPTCRLHGSVNKTVDQLTSCCSYTTNYIITGIQ